MLRFAVVPAEGGVVSNVVVGDDLATVASIVGSCVQETAETGLAEIGYTWNGATFVAPPEPAE